MKEVHTQRRIASPYTSQAAVKARKAAAPRKPAKRPVLSLGDAVERVAKPIAKRVDSLAADFGRPTALAGCSACSRRRRFLNQLVPDVASWRAWRGLFGRWRGAWRAHFGRPRLH